jgi:hypothetical protein
MSFDLDLAIGLFNSFSEIFSSHSPSFFLHAIGMKKKCGGWEEKLSHFQIGFVVG